ncbi:MAG TPA: LD-carboxypeptidase [Ferruginibacter sp.]|nr:LD-carboxypeptidase [Ferruginibacter sp.]
MITTPPALRKGQTIGMTCPAGYMPKENAATCIRTLQAWGYEVLVGQTLGSDSDNYFSASDEERLFELQAMLDAPEVHAILFGRGGYGMSRIIDRLDFKAFKKNPKWLIGFSDITLLHNHIHRKFGISTIHGPMAAAFQPGNGYNENVQSLQQALKGKKINYRTNPHPQNQIGKASGVLVGGNLAILAHAIGTPSDINTDGKILLLEDVGEYRYNIDRLLYQLKRAGKLKNLTAAVIGTFTDTKDTVRPFGQSVTEIIQAVFSEYTYPLCFEFPVGHGTENRAVKLGINYQLTISKQAVSLKELAG